MNQVQGIARGWGRIWIGLYRIEQAQTSMAPISRWRQLARMVVKFSTLGVLGGILGTQIRIHQDTVGNLGGIQRLMTARVLDGDKIRGITRQGDGNRTVPFVVHSLEQSVQERTFLNNTGLFVELEGSTDI